MSCMIQSLKTLCRLHTTKISSPLILTTNIRVPRSMTTKGFTVLPSKMSITPLTKLPNTPIILYNQKSQYSTMRSTAFPASVTKMTFMVKTVIKLGLHGQTVQTMGLNGQMGQTMVLNGQMDQTMELHGQMYQTMGLNGQMGQTIPQQPLFVIQEIRDTHHLELGWTSTQWEGMDPWANKGCII